MAEQLRPFLSTRYRLVTRCVSSTRECGAAPGFVCGLCCGSAPVLSAGGRLAGASGLALPERPVDPSARCIISTTQSSDRAMESLDPGAPARSLLAAGPPDDAALTRVHHQRASGCRYPLHPQVPSRLAYPHSRNVAPPAFSSPGAGVIHVAPGRLLAASRTYRRQVPSISAVAGLEAADARGAPVRVRPAHPLECSARVSPDRHQIGSRRAARTYRRSHG